MVAFLPSCSATELGQLRDEVTIHLQVVHRPIADLRPAFRGFASSPLFIS